MNPRSQNPYVGPRAFQDGEMLYGRDREVKKLLNLLIAERIVLLYSPSGAGKTSLVQAALIPELREEGFQVLPVIRVGMEPPPDLDLPATANRYILSTLLSLEEGLPPKQQMPLEELAGMDLTTYLDRRSTEDIEMDGDVLIFDQFEEIITVDPTDQAAKAAFFAQLGKALRPRDRWVLFAMREEYPAGLDPYLRPVPTRLSTTFRLELLGAKAARQAMQEPACQAGVPFNDIAAAKLIDDLRRVQVQQPDGTTAEQPGLYIEPVQLQVVCYRLWENLPEEATEIRETDIREAGDVDSALAGYYADRVKTTVESTGVRERGIREWFDSQLITEQGIRGQVLRGPEQSQGLANEAIEPLVDAHLVRAENRRGATWYELAHDRLIEPIRKNNVRWFQEHLSPLQRQAALWGSQSRSNGLLLRDEALVKAEIWADHHENELITIECDFLAACREARVQAQRERRKNRFIQGLAIVATIIMCVAIYFFFQARDEARKARQAEEVAEVEATRAREAEKMAELRAEEALKAKDDTEEARSQAEARREEAEKASKLAEEQRQLALEAEKKAKEAQKEAELNSSRFQEMVNATFGFLLESGQNKEFLTWTEKNISIEKLGPAVDLMIDLSEKLDEEEKAFWHTALPNMTEAQKLELLNILGTEAAEKVRKKEEFRITQVGIQDATGMIIEPVNDIYVIKIGEPVTMRVDVTNSHEHKIEVQWTAYRGKVSPTSQKTTTYTTEKTGSDIVIIHIRDIETGEQIQEPINITVVQ